MKRFSILKLLRIFKAAISILHGERKFYMGLNRNRLLFPPRWSESNSATYDVSRPIVSVFAA